MFYTNSKQKNLFPVYYRCQPRKLGELLTTFIVKCPDGTKSGGPKTRARVHRFKTDARPYSVNVRVIASVVAHFLSILARAIASNWFTID